MDEKFVVRDRDGKPLHAINHYIVNRQNISDEILEEIKHLHIVRDDINKSLLAIIEDTSTSVNFKGLIKSLLSRWSDNEFKLQELWGFPADVNFHRFWDIPGCKCPKMDNDERVGVDQKIITSTCPYHGNKN
jgi:hypothetical protein